MGQFAVTKYKITPHRNFVGIDLWTQKDPVARPWAGKTVHIGVYSSEDYGRPTAMFQTISTEELAHLADWLLDHVQEIEEALARVKNRVERIGTISSMCVKEILYRIDVDKTRECFDIESIPEEKWTALHGEETREQVYDAFMTHWMDLGNHISEKEFIEMVRQEFGERYDGTVRLLAMER